MDLRKLGCILFTLGFLLYSASFLIPSFTLVYTYLAFPEVIQTHVTKTHADHHHHNPSQTVSDSRLTHDANGSLAVPHMIHHVLLEEPRAYGAWKEAKRSCHDLHPTWDFVPWDNAKGEAFVLRNYPELLPMYLRYHYPIQRSYLLRYLVLHHYGGIFLDTDLICVTPLDAVRTDPPGFLAPLSTPSELDVDFMVATPQHPFLEFAIQHIKDYDMRWASTYATNVLPLNGQFLTRMRTLYPDRRLLSHFQITEDKPLVEHITSPSLTQSGSLFVTAALRTFLSSLDHRSRLVGAGLLLSLFAIVGIVLMGLVRLVKTMKKRKDRRGRRNTIKHVSSGSHANRY